MVRYTIPSSSEGITVITRLEAPQFGQDTAHSFVKEERAREFVRDMRDKGVRAAVIALLSISPGGPFVGIYTAYKQSIMDKIVDYSDKYPGVYVKVIKSTYGTFYAVEPWTDTSKAYIELQNSDNASEKVVEVERL